MYVFQPIYVWVDCVMQINTSFIRANNNHKNKTNVNYVCLLPSKYSHSVD